METHGCSCKFWKFSTKKVSPLMTCYRLLVWETLTTCAKHCIALNSLFWLHFRVTLICAQQILYSRAQHCPWLVRSSTTSVCFPHAHLSVPDWCVNKNHAPLICRLAAANVLLPCCMHVQTISVLTVAIARHRQRRPTAMRPGEEPLSMLDDVAAATLASWWKTFREWFPLLHAPTVYVNH